MKLRGELTGQDPSSRAQYLLIFVATTKTPRPLAPTLASMRTVARAHGVGGRVRLAAHRTRGRYVLVWFTKLPPDRAGTFQVSVYDIKLHGHP